jgi:ABC-2 type transporter
MVGYVQLSLILPGARFIFHVPMIGSLLLLVAVAGIFIAANLALGSTFSTIANTQLQAIQTAVFFLLPSILLSGLTFPLRGMPIWAQWVGELLPATYFLRVVGGILLKRNGWVEILANIWPLFCSWWDRSPCATKRRSTKRDVTKRGSHFCTIRPQYHGFSCAAPGACWGRRASVFSAPLSGAKPSRKAGRCRSVPHSWPVRASNRYRMIREHTLP